MSSTIHILNWQYFKLFVYICVSCLFTIFSDDGKFSTMRNLLGKSLHSIQKFYAHSNWLELGNENVLDLIWDDFGNVADEYETTCDDSDIIVEKLTSGYFPHNVSSTYSVNRTKF